MSQHKLSDLLSHIKKPENPKEIKMKVVEIIQSHTGICVDIDNIKINDTVIFLTVPSTLRNAVFLKKQLICSDIKNSQLPSLENISDIR